MANIFDGVRTREQSSGASIFDGARTRGQEAPDASIEEPVNRSPVGFEERAVLTGAANPEAEVEWLRRAPGEGGKANQYNLLGIKTGEGRQYDATLNSKGDVVARLQGSKEPYGLVHAKTSWSHPIESLGNIPGEAVDLLQPVAQLLSLPSKPLQVGTKMGVDEYARRLYGQAYGLKDENAGMDALKQGALGASLTGVLQGPGQIAKTLQRPAAALSNRLGYVADKERQDAINAIKGKEDVLTADQSAAYVRTLPAKTAQKETVARTDPAFLARDQARVELDLAKRRAEEEAAAAKVAAESEIAAGRKAAEAPAPAAEPPAAPMAAPKKGSLKRVSPRVREFAEEHGVDPKELADTSAALWEEAQAMREGSADLSQAAKEARKRLGLTQGKINKWEDAGKDYSSWPGIDEVANEMAPRLGWDTEFDPTKLDLNHAERLWDLMKTEGATKTGKYDLEYLQRSLPMLQKVKEMEGQVAAGRKAAGEFKITAARPVSRLEGLQPAEAGIVLPTPRAGSLRETLLTKVLDPAYGISAAEMRAAPDWWALVAKHNPEIEGIGASRAMANRDRVFRQLSRDLPRSEFLRRAEAWQQDAAAKLLGSPLRAELNQEAQEALARVIKGVADQKAEKILGDLVEASIKNRKVPDYLAAARRAARETAEAARAATAERTAARGPVKEAQAAQAREAEGFARRRADIDQEKLRIPPGASPAQERFRKWFETAERLTGAATGGAIGGAVLGYPGAAGGAYAGRRLKLLEGATKGLSAAGKGLEGLVRMTPEELKALARRNPGLVGDLKKALTWAAGQAAR